MTAVLIIVLDTEVTDELLDEGFVRETISKIQNLRKESGFEVTDYIDIFLSCNEEQRNIYEENTATIKKEVLCKEIFFEKGGDFGGIKDINGSDIYIGVTKK